ncbi:MAG: hypothetical protein F4144_00960 [Acidimicrobiaceae bacterium]|nr:hypothetical protein [Acidimicrobiaceae bacterium]
MSSLDSSVCWCGWLLLNCCEDRVAKAVGVGLPGPEGRTVTRFARRPWVRPLRAGEGKARCRRLHRPRRQEKGVAVSSGLVWAAVAAWAAMGVYVSVTDVRRAVIPRRAVWPAGIAVAVLLGAAAVAAGELARFGWAAAVAAAVALALEVVYRRWPDKMGFGDVRLIVVNSLLAGWWDPAWALWALMAGALAEWPVAIVSLARHGREARVRWAPGLVAGTAAVLAWRLWVEGPVP